MKDRSRTCHNDIDLLDMAIAARLERKLVVYLVYKVDVANIIPDAFVSPCPSVETKQSNVDPCNTAQSPIPYSSIKMDQVAPHIWHPKIL